MEVLYTILATVVPVFAIIIAGTIYGRFKSLPSAQITDLLLWIMIPCLVLGSIGSKPLSLAELGGIGAAAGLVVGGCGLVSFLLFLGRPERRASLLATMFMNSANMAFPLAILAFGDEGLIRQLVFYIAIHLLHVTLGIAIASGTGGLKEVFKLPLVYVAAAAIALAASGVVIPDVVAKPLDLVGKATIPLMLLMLGMRLRTAKFAHLGPALVASIVRLGVGFAMGILAVYLFDLTGFARAAVLLGSVMPSAVLNFVLSEKYGLKPEFMASTVVLSTLISFGTTPLVLWYIASS